MTHCGEAFIGVNGFGHDSSAALVDAKTGEVLFACAEERVSNIKHDWHLPAIAIQRCFDAAARGGRIVAGAGINFRTEEFITGTLVNELRQVLDNPEQAVRLGERFLELSRSAGYLTSDAKGLATAAVREWIGAEKISPDAARVLLRRASWYYNWAVKYVKIEAALRERFAHIPVTFFNHHLAHAASAFYNSGFERAAVLVIDGQGESDTVSIYKAGPDGLKRVSRTGWPCSLGIFYLFATEQLGFKLGDEYKVMGMSAYGKPTYLPYLRETMSVNERGVLEFHETRFFKRQEIPGTGHVVYNFNDDFRRIVRPHIAGKPFEQLHYDFAASIQRMSEEIGVALARRAVELTGEAKIAIAGGVGLNGLMNGCIRRDPCCEKMFVYPAAADDGTAVGAAQLLAARNSAPSISESGTSIVTRNSAMDIQPTRAVYLGYDGGDSDAIERELQRLGLNYQRPDDLHATLAQALVDRKIVARYTGCAEFGPRALGHRSILASAADAAMKDVLNLRVKHREEFRPFAPACLREHVNEYFEIDEDAPFMLLICRAKELARKQVPAIVHADGTARVQTVTAEHNPDFHATLTAYKALTGVPVCVNTSFNVNGETIVDSPLDAIESFGFMDIDYLAIGPFWVAKAENAAAFPPMEHGAYLALRQKRYADCAPGALAEIDIAKFDPAFFPNFEQLYAAAGLARPVSTPNAMMAALNGMRARGLYNPTLEFRRAVALAKEGRKAEAVATLNEVVRRAPHLSDAATLLEHLQRASA
jgi:carbamoyltransferase